MNEEQTVERIAEIVEHLDHEEAKKFKALMLRSESDPVGTLRVLHGMLGRLLDRLEKEGNGKRQSWSFR